MATADNVSTAGGRTTVQLVALIFGVGFLLAAVAGFLVTGMTNMDPDPATAPRALGLFPVNVLHNIVHLIFGIWGLIASRTFSSAKSYCILTGSIYVFLVALGFLSPNGFGLLPLGGYDPLLHIVLGAPLVYVGMTAKPRT